MEENAENGFNIDWSAIQFADEPIVIAIVAGVALFALVATTLNPIIEFLRNVGLWPRGEESSNSFGKDLIASINKGKLSEEGAIKLAYALAGKRYDNSPPSSEELPTGQDPADKFIREFVALATSKNEREREAAALDAEGRTEEALALLEALAEEEAEQACERWKARGAMAFNAFTAKAIDSYERAIGAAPDDAEAHNQLGQLYDRTGELDRAQAAYEKVLSLGNHSADQNLLAVAYGNLGLIEQTRGNLDAAKAYQQQSLELDKALGRKEGMAAAYGNLGNVEESRGNLDAAEGYYKKALKLGEELGQKERIAIQYTNLGIIEEQRGDFDAAIAHWRKSHALYAEMGVPHMMEKLTGWLRDVGAPVDGDAE